MKNKFLIAFAIGFLALASCTTGKDKPANSHNSSTVNSSIPIAETPVNKLINSRVCMVNNKFMDKEQIAVPVNGETYYGCCEGCVSQLKNGTDIRYALDPLTGEKVDKAIAVIIVKPGTKDEVLYFKSEDNVKKYIEK